ncbi:ribonuclease T2 precursor [Esox lucius]|uniref:Ribonuclease T2 n=1 Tax=Esox lucius TaxID=8010 RepID=C1BXI1_ESOLU|nr:ribonuclease T2 precursor [Esox lucius]ACO13734.1 Ribonuclease T2 [Esox lucius]
MKSWALVVLLCLGYGLLTSSLQARPMWSNLILTHHWPSTFCSVQHCHSTFDYWTLHGLWPNLGQECNSSWHFNETLIQDLLPDMNKSWPDLKKPGSSKFWKYEWQKHGTCAAKAESLNSQHKYFDKALELYHKLDLDGVLKSVNIVPSETYYMFDHIEGSLINLYKVKPKIQCNFPEGENFQILGQIEICFNSDFQLDDCVHDETDTVTLTDFLNVKGTGFRVCDHSKPVYYPPLKGKPSM